MKFKGHISPSLKKVTDVCVCVCVCEEDKRGQKGVSSDDMTA